MQRKPEKIRYEDIPNIDLVRGVHTRWLVSAEANGADQVCLGMCYHDPDMADFEFDQVNDETFYCAKGKLKLLYDDKKGTKGEIVADEGEVIFAPRGYHCILRATGVDSINVFTHKAISLAHRPEYSKELEKYGQRRAK